MHDGKFLCLPNDPCQDLVLQAVTEVAHHWVRTGGMPALARIVCQQRQRCFASCLQLHAVSLHKGLTFRGIRPSLEDAMTRSLRCRWAERVDADGMPPPAPRPPAGHRVNSAQGYAPWNGQGSGPWDAQGAEPWSRQGSPPWHGQGEGSLPAQGGDPCQGQGLEAWGAGRAYQAGHWAQAGIVEQEQSCGNAWDDRSSGRWSSLAGMPPPQVDHIPGPGPPRASPWGLGAPADAEYEPSPGPRPGPNPSRCPMRGVWARSLAEPGAQLQPGAWRPGSGPGLSEDAIVGAAADAFENLNDAVYAPPNPVSGASEGECALWPACPYLTQGFSAHPAARDAIGACGAASRACGAARRARDAATQMLRSSLQQQVACAAQQERGQQQLWRTAPGHAEGPVAPGRSASSVGSPSSSAGSERSAAGAVSPGAGRAAVDPSTSPGQGGGQRAGMMAEAGGAPGAPFGERSAVAQSAPGSSHCASSGRSWDVAAVWAGDSAPADAARMVQEWRLPESDAAGFRFPAGASRSRGAPHAAEAGAATQAVASAGQGLPGYEVPCTAAEALASHAQPPAWRGPPGPELTHGLGGPQTPWEPWHRPSPRGAAPGQVQAFTEAGYWPESHATTPGPLHAALDPWYGPGGQASAPRQTLASLQAWHDSVGRAPAQEQPGACSEAWHEPFDSLAELPHDPQNSMRWVDHPAAGAPSRWDASLASNPSTGGASREAEPVSGRAEAEGLPRMGLAARGSGSGPRSARDLYGTERDGVQAGLGSLRSRQTARCGGRSSNARGPQRARTRASDLLTDALDRSLLQRAAGGAAAIVRGPDRARTHATNVLAEAVERSPQGAGNGIGLDPGVGSLPPSCLLCQTS